MKPSTKASVLMLTGSALLMIGVFGKPLGIPDGFETIPILVAIVFNYLGYRAIKKAKAEGQIPQVPESQKRRRIGLAVACCAVACFSMPFLLPVTGVVLPFTTEVVISAVSFFFCVGAIWLGIKMST